MSAGGKVLIGFFCLQGVKVGLANLENDARVGLAKPGTSVMVKNETRRALAPHTTNVPTRANAGLAKNQADKVQKGDVKPQRNVSVFAFGVQLVC